MKGALIIGTIRLLGRLTLPGAHRLGNLIGRMLWITNSRTRKVTEANLRYCFPDMPEADREALARASLRQTGMQMAETGISWAWPGDRALALVKKVRNPEILDRSMADPRGVIILMAHIGNWEMINDYFCARYEGYAIYRPPKLRELDQFITERRSGRGAGKGVHLVPTSREGVELMYQKAREGHALFILPDQEPSMKSGLFAPFFGRPALSSKLASLIQQDTGCQMIAAYVLRLPDSAGFELCFREVEAGYDDCDLLTSVTAINRTVELIALEAPEQYQWEYKRFKRRPEGEPKLY